MKKNYLLLATLLLSSCNVDHSSLNIITPTGAPAIAFYNHVNNSHFETNSTPSNIVAMMNSSSNYDIVVIDTVSGLKAIEKGANYKIAATLTFGNFYIASTGNDDNNKLDKDDTIILFGQNQTPDLLFNYIYGDGYNIEYVTNVQDAAKCLASGKNLITGSTVDYVFIAQPALYTMLNNKNAATYGKSSIYTNIQNEYLRKSNSSIIQASLFVKGDSNRAEVKSFLKSLENDILNLLETPTLLNEIDNEANSTLLGVNIAAISKTIEDNNSLGLGYKKAIDNKEAIDKFISMFGMEVTDEEIYF